jgi:cytochrome c-type biogenesis protein CcmH/NrfG
VESDLNAMSETDTAGPQKWKSGQLYAMAGVCLAIGLIVGYLFRGSESRRAPQATAVPPTSSAGGMSAPSAPAHMPSLDALKHMADKKAEPLLAKLKTDPKNSDLLNQLGTLYKATHQFQEAAGYYQRAIEADPKNVGARTDLASCLFYQGDADGAIKQLQQALTYDPKDANSLFNLGMIRLQAKNDSSGAVTAWRQLLKLNPTLPKDKKQTVEKMIAQAHQTKLAE